jgi:MFS transporter, putative metabolite:H+ symporter
MTEQADATDAASSFGAESADQIAGRLFASLDASRFSAKHLRLYLNIVVMHFFDGFDLLMMGVVLPGIISEFHLTHAQAGVLASSVFGGMLVGAIAITWLADRIGRKLALAFSIVLYAICTLMAAMATEYQELLVFRALSGIGLGAEVPLVFTYLTEFLPIRNRGQFASSSIFFWQISGVAAALAAIVVIPAYSWRGMFLIGVAPALILAATWFSIPESVRYLVRRGRLTEAEKIVRSLSTVPPEGLPPALVAVDQRRRRLSDIFAGAYRRYTLGAWFVNFSMGLIFAGLNVWLPSIFMKQGFTLVHSFAFTALITTVGAVGNIANGYLLERFGRRLTISALFAIGAVSVLAWGVSSTPVGIIAFGMVTAFTAGGGIGGSVYTYLTELYPTEYRAIGTGCSTACQRLGGIVAPSVLGLLLGSLASLTNSFIIISALMAVTALIAFLYTYETRGKSLEQIAGELGGISSSSPSDRLTEGAIARMSDFAQSRRQ